ncbi:MAG: hypothetical protein HQ507_13030 [Candidatus Marinimicrobia bacterium]|nr:hypothetical protein [Candidatus Neomarinimicrobiota bacterium]
MKVELHYFDECPSYKDAFSNFQEAVLNLGMKCEIEWVQVEDADHAQSINFQGSPSILIDGIDLEGKQEPAVFGCRIYHIDGKLTGTPTKAYITKMIKALAS